MVEIFTDRIEISNSGEPLVDTLRFIDTSPIPGMRIWRPS